MKHRSVTHSFILLPILNPSAEQAQPPVFSVSGTKPAARPDLLLFLGSSLGRANARTHQSGRHRLSLNSSSPLENGGLPLSGVYSLPRASLRDWLSGCSYDALPGTLTRTAHPQGFPQGTPSPKGTHPQTARLYPWLSLALQDSLSRKKQSGSASSSWSGYPSAACSRYSSSYAPDISGQGNRENTPESSSLNLNYHLRLPEAAHSGPAVSYLPQKFSSSRSFRARRGRYAKALSCLPQLCPRQPRCLLSYPCPAEEQGNARLRKDTGSYSRINRAYAIDQNQSKSSGLTLILRNGTLYPRPNSLSTPAQYPAGKAPLHKERGLTFLNSRSGAAIDPGLLIGKGILFLWSGVAQPESFPLLRRLPPAHSRYDSRPVNASPAYNGLFLRTQSPLLPRPVATSTALRLEPYRREDSCLQKYSEKTLAPYAYSLLSYALAHHPFRPIRGHLFKLVSGILPLKGAMCHFYLLRLKFLASNLPLQP